MDNKQIDKIFKLVRQNQNRVNLNTLNPNIKWKK